MTGAVRRSENIPLIECYSPISKSTTNDKAKSNQIPYEFSIKFVNKQDEKVNKKRRIALRLT